MAVNEKAQRFAIKAIKQAIAKKCIDAKNSSDNNKVPYGMIAKLVNEHKGRFENLTVQMVKNEMARFWKMEPKAKDVHPTIPPMATMLGDSDTEPETESDSETQSLTRGKPGRPKGSTQDAKEDKVIKFENMQNAITEDYRVGRIEAARNGCDRLPKGRLEEIIYERQKEYGLDDYVNPQTIRNRFDKDRFDVHGRGTVTPALHLEEALVDLLVKLADMNKPFSCGEGLKLANDLLRDTATKETIIGYKQKMKYKCKGDKQWINKNGYILGKKWWNKFMKRNRRYLTSAKGRKFSLNRENWCTYSNFLNIYKCIYQEMVDAGVAMELDIPVYMDLDGNVVDVEDGYGRK